MWNYVLRRLLIGTVVLWMVSVIVYLGLSLAPGDELTVRLSPEVVAQLTPDQIAEKRHALGLDRPLPLRYVTWLKSTLSGDLGTSSSDGLPVAEDIRAHLGPTAMLVGAALVVGTALALAVGVAAAVRSGTAVDYLLGSAPILLVGIPGFVLSLAAIYLFSVQFGLLPTNGMHTLGDESFGDLLLHMALPGSVLAIGVAAPLIRYTRASMLDVLSSEYIVTARAKGLRPSRVLWSHAFRNALLPIITVIGLTLPEMVAGAVIVEQVFGWPGMGQLAVRAAGNRDVSLMMGIVIVIAVSVVVTNLLADLAYVRADPRVRLV
ncbi:ABC transporter permease [Dactylosporangium sp. NPDC051485]|uniref:ABC transporter permease n=1 Tax=Dactylosporangium sp. NPDC051485 TaxID=3154846 RepID=UPI003439994D